MRLFESSLNFTLKSFNLALWSTFYSFILALRSATDFSSFSSIAADDFSVFSSIASRWGFRSLIIWSFESMFLPAPPCLLTVDFTTCTLFWRVLILCIITSSKTFCLVAISSREVSASSAYSRFFLIRSTASKLTKSGSVVLNLFLDPFGQRMGSELFSRGFSLENFFY